MLEQPPMPELPFLQALCWQQQPDQLQEEEVLAVYERGWRYRGVLADPSEVELGYIRQLAHRAFRFSFDSCETRPKRS